MKHTIIDDKVLGNYRDVTIKLKPETSSEANEIKNYLNYSIQPEQKEIIDDYLKMIHFNGWGICLADPQRQEGVFKITFERVRGIGGF